MSGRKSSEVASVLRSSENLQDQIIKDYTDKIKDQLNEARKLERQLEGQSGERIVEISNLNSNINRLNNNIKTNRKKSEEIRNKIRCNPHYCDNEYREAQILQRENRQIEKDFSQCYGDLTSLNTKLNSKYNDKKEEFWTKEIKKLNKREDKKDFYNIKKQFLDQDYIELNSLDFIKLYGTKGDLKNVMNYKNLKKMTMPSEINLMVERINDLNESLRKLEDSCIKIMSKATEEAYLSNGICDVMEGLGFDVELIPNTEDETITGYRIECRNGDSIDFTSVNINEDGEPKIEIDHTHGNYINNCGVKWSQVKDAFNNLGIPMTTVRKNGIDILHKKTKVKTPDTGKRMGGR